MADSREELALQALEDALRDITVANGYEIEVARVRRWHDEDADVAVGGGKGVIKTGDLETSYDPQLNDASLNDTDWRIQLRLWGINNARQRVSQFIADVRKRLHVGAEAQEWTAEGIQDVMVRRARRFVGSTSSDDVVGAVLFIAVSWRDKKVDPYLAAGA